MTHEAGANVHTFALAPCVIKIISENPFLTLYLKFKSIRERR